MPDNIEITINGKDKFTGRLIGAITAHECKAILNTKDAARKIYTAESTMLNDISPVANKRLVVATSNYSSDDRREVFISPIVRCITYLNGDKLYRCADNSTYEIKDI